MKSSQRGDNPLECYGEWDMRIPSIQPRSRLYCLEPIGIGTAYVESLTSYIARLAGEHHVTPKYLVMKVILPLQGQVATTPTFYFRLNKLWRDAFTLNGFSSTARQWVETLQALTSCNNLRFLTMMTWSEVIAADRLLRHSKVWCPLCYEEYRQAHQAIFEPLLWLVNGVDVCPRHLQPLTVRCPSCLGTLPLLAQDTRPGYCHHCKCWLGSSNAVWVPEHHADDFEKQLWKAKVVGELIAAAPELPMPPPKGQIATMISLCLDKYSRGSLDVLARLLKVTKESLWKYLQGSDLPYFDTLSTMCSILSIPPLEFLTANSISTSMCPHFEIDDIRTMPRNTRRLSADGLLYARQVVEALLAEEADPFPTLGEIARRLGCSVVTLRRHFPDLCRSITSHVRRKYADAAALSLIRSNLDEMLVSDERPPLSAVAKQLGCSSAKLHKYFPEHCRALVKRYRERNDYEQVRRRLEEVLANNEEAPSVKELARLMGCKYQNLRNHFPELCKRITARHKANLRKRREERLANHRSRIRQAVLVLHQQGIYPSPQKVGRLLKDMAVIHLLRLPEGHEVWKTTLKELGYAVV